MKTPSLLFLIINFYNESEVVDFITQLTLQKFRDYKVVVVNNGSDKLQWLQKQIILTGEVMLVNPQKNLGYLGGAAFGLTEFRMQYQMPDKLIVCNTDIAFTSDMILSAIEDLKADVIGPAIISSKTKTDQNPFYTVRISKSKMHFLKFIFSFYLFYLVYQSLALAKNVFKKRAITKQSKEPLKVYAVHGSFMIFNKSYFEKGGSFNFGSFLYGEEIFVAEIARGKNMEVHYNPSIKVVHKEHSTTGTFKKPLHIRFMKQSINYLIKNFFS